MVCFDPARCVADWGLNNLQRTQPLGPVRCDFGTAARPRLKMEPGPALPRAVVTRGESAAPRLATKRQGGVGRLYQQLIPAFWNLSPRER